MDPHIVTGDGANYTFNALGDFWLVQGVCMHTRVLLTALSCTCTVDSTVVQSPTACVAACTNIQLARCAVTAAVNTAVSSSMAVAMPGSTAAFECLCVSSAWCVCKAATASAPSKFAWRNAPGARAVQTLRQARA